MGRQAYLNRLALGRSPYEAPDSTTADSPNHVRRVSNVHADNYMQEYDSRGHPINSESKTLGKDLRRAKNDILSTMGIVSRGDRNAGIPNEQQKLAQIASENDFGLVVTTLDQLSIFFGTWWTSSLTGRVQAYRHYTHSALMNAIQYERDSMGILNFYFAGIPAWTISSGLAIARENPLKRVFVSLREYLQRFTGESKWTRSLFGLAYTVARHTVLVLSVEFYMHSTLQSLSLVSPYSIPALDALLPFSEHSLIQSPTLPTDLSPHSLGASIVSLLTSPGVLAFLYGYYLRPQLEERIYRLIRRRLPKPNLPDELSVRVAYEENLIEWVVPTLGRRSDEELHRSKLTFFEDIKCEVGVFRRWVFSLFGLMSRKSTDRQALQTLRDEKIASLRNSIEMLQHEIEGVRPNIVTEDEPSDTLSRSVDGSPDSSATAAIPPPPSQEEARSRSLNNGSTDATLNQVLTNENRMAQSPEEMSNIDFLETAISRQTNGLSAASNQHNQSSESQNGVNLAADWRDSRSDTLFSPPSSPETPGATSPHVGASSLHPDSNNIAMQLELLSHIDPMQSLQLAHLASSASNEEDRSALAGLIEHLIMNPQPQRRPPWAQIDPPSLTTGASTPNPLDVGAPGEILQHMAQSAQATGQMPIGLVEEALEAFVPNILPDGVEEPNDEEPFGNTMPIAVTSNHDDAQSDTLVQPTTLPSFLIPVQLTDSSSQAHRVTLLSAYPVDSLASHLATAISSIVLGPLEALYFRSLAHSWIITHPSSNTRLSNLHPLDLWFGGRTWSDVGAYTCRLVLMKGMQVAMRAGIWGFLVGSTMRLGRNFCGWGKL